MRYLMGANAGNQLRSGLIKGRITIISHTTVDLTFSSSTCTSASPFKSDTGMIAGREVIFVCLSRSHSFLLSRQARNEQVALYIQYGCPVPAVLPTLLFTSFLNNKNPLFPLVLFHPKTPRSRNLAPARAQDFCACLLACLLAFIS